MPFPVSLSFSYAITRSHKFSTEPVYFVLQLFTTIWLFVVAVKHKERHEQSKQTSVKYSGGAESNYKQPKCKYKNVRSMCVCVFVPRCTRCSLPRAMRRAWVGGADDSELRVLLAKSNICTDAAELCLGALVCTANNDYC